MCSESEDAFEWSILRPAVMPDVEDEEWAAGREGYQTRLSGMSIMRYESMVLGLLQVFRCTDTETGDGFI
jgi:hypothetical protein